MKKLYIKQSPLLRKEIDMMREIAMTSTSEDVMDDVFKFTKHPVEASIFEVEDKYKKLISSFSEESTVDLKLETFGASLSKDCYIRPHIESDRDDKIKYIVITKAEDSKDLKDGAFRIFSGDGYMVEVGLEKGSSICFKGETKYEISRVVEGSSLLFVSLVYEK